MIKEVVYPVWIWQKPDGTYKAKSFDFDIISQSPGLKNSLEILKEKIEKRVYFLQKHGIELPSPASVGVDREDKYIKSELISIDTQAYEKFINDMIEEDIQ